MSPVLRVPCPLAHLGIVHSIYGHLRSWARHLNFPLYSSKEGREVASSLAHYGLFDFYTFGHLGRLSMSTAVTWSQAGKERVGGGKRHRRPTRKTYVPDSRLTGSCCSQAHPSNGHWSIMNVYCRPLVKSWAALKSSFSHSFIHDKRCTYFRGKINGRHHTKPGLTMYNLRNPLMNGAHFSKAKSMIETLAKRHDSIREPCEQVWSSSGAHLTQAAGDFGWRGRRARGSCTAAFARSALAAT